MEEKYPGHASRNTFLKFVRCVATEQNRITTTTRTAILLLCILIYSNCEIESLGSEAESSSGKKINFNVYQFNLKFIYSCGRS